MGRKALRCKSSWWLCTAGHGGLSPGDSMVTELDVISAPEGAYQRHTVHKRTTRIQQTINTGGGQELKMGISQPQGQTQSRGLEVRGSKLKSCVVLLS